VIKIEADAAFTGYISQLTVSWSWGFNGFKRCIKNININKEASW
jgi:hypothetical protein